MKGESISEQLIRHEGKIAKMYLDSKGIPTIGIGWNLRDCPMRESEIAYRLDNDIHDVIIEIRNKFDWFGGISNERQKAIIDIVFNLGMAKFLEFKKTIGYMAQGDWYKAADELLDSDYAKEVPARAKEIAQMLRVG